MAVKTRINLDASSVVVRDETGTALNTALRVGTLFEDLSDSAALLRERGCVSLSTSVSTPFTPAAGDTPEKLTYAMTSVVSTPYNVSSETSPRVQWTGLVGLPYRVSALLNFNGSNGREYYFYIAKNGVIDPSTKVSVHLASSNPHAVVMELFTSGAAYYEIWIEQETGANQITLLNGQLSLMSV
jgi:hypothetical protein